MHSMSLFLMTTLLFFSSSILAGEYDDAPPKNSGLSFSCSPEGLKTVQKEMAAWFIALGIDPSLVVQKGRPEQGNLLYTLNTPESDTTTFDFYKRPQYQLKDDTLTLNYADGKKREIKAVSQKEILLAFMQHGRLTEFKDGDCSISVLKDHIGVRQRIAAWTENTWWNWPGDNNPGATAWNYDLWTHDGTPKKGVSAQAAFADVFTNPLKYAPYCYTASKLTVTNGILDYYKYVKNDPATLDKLETRLWLDGDPLVDIDPTLNADNVSIVGTGKPFVDASAIIKGGKLIDATFNVSPNNFIPGDWAYFLNTDPRSANIRGFEGSNTIYLGRDKFDDYYHEHGGSFSKTEKLEEIYLWQGEGIVPKPNIIITDAIREKLNHTPTEGGIVENFRWVPYRIGGNPLPPFEN